MTEKFPEIAPNIKTAVHHWLQPFVYYYNLLTYDMAATPCFA